MNRQRERKTSDTKTDERMDRQTVKITQSSLTVCLLDIHDTADD